LVLTRQDVPTFDRKKYSSAAGVERGGYILADMAEKNSLPDVIFMSTGSELQLAVAAHEQLVADGIKSRVVSVPSFELFDAQPATYRDEVLPPRVTARVAIEAGVRQCWDKYLGSRGAFMGLDTYGASAPYQAIYKHRGLTAEAVLAKARELCGRGE
jgi:transketolase